MARPMVKGTLLAVVVGELRERREKQSLTNPQLAALCSSEALALLDRQILISQWYPMELYSQLIGAFFKLVGGGAPAFMREWGRAAAERLHEAGVYNQLNALNRLDVHDSRQRHFYRARVLSTLGNSFYNFISIQPEWSTEDENCIRYTFDGVAHWPECLIFANEGFISFTEGFNTTGIERIFTERLTPDRMVVSVFHKRGTL